MPRARIPTNRIYNFQAGNFRTYTVPTAATWTINADPALEALLEQAYKPKAADPNQKFERMMLADGSEVSAIDNTVIGFYSGAQLRLLRYSRSRKQKEAIDAEEDQEVGEDI